MAVRNGKCAPIKLALLLAGAATAWCQQTATEPFNTSDRFAYFLQRTFSGERMLLLGADTTLDHLLGSDHWDRSPASWGRRYGTHLADRFTRNTLELGLGMALREDGRFRPGNAKGFRARTWYAVRHAFMARLPDGRERFAYSRFGAAAAAEILPAPWSMRSVTTGQVAGDLLSFGLDQIQNSLLTEFSPDLRRFGRRMWQRLLPRK